MTYSSTYKGAGRNGYVYTSTPMRSSVSTGLAQTPTASMSSTGAYGTYSSTMSSRISTGGYLASSKQNVGGIRTSAEYIRGGVTTAATYGHVVGPRRVVMEEQPGTEPGNPGGCHCVDENGDHICDHCGATLSGDEFDGYSCANDPCWCPIGDGWQVWLFMIALAGAYVAWKTRSKKINEA